jgi:hypothetical protein
MKVRYDREADILAIEWLPEGVIDHAEHTGSLIAHFTADGSWCSWRSWMPAASWPRFSRRRCKGRGC